MGLKNGRLKNQPKNVQLQLIFIFVFILRTISDVGCCEFCDASLLHHDYKFSIDNDTKDTKADDDYRLPSTTRPNAYTIGIGLNMTHFQGKVSIEIEATAASDSIVMHAARALTITNVALLNSIDQSDIPLRDFTTDNEHQFLILKTVNVQLIEGEKYTVTINYFGKLVSRAKEGFISSSYTNSTGENVWFAYTKLENTFARNMFPCYDEPGLKATFQISIEHDCRYNAFSNMPETRTCDFSSCKCKTEFAQSPLMSTYLISIFVSDFEFVENYHGPIQPSRIKHRVFTPRMSEFINKAQAPLEASEKLLTQMEQYFGQKYPLTKIDHIGIPEYMDAMEYFGIINYKSEWLFYVSPTTLQEKRDVLNVVETIAHEMSHQWIGNLVTPENWSYLWLNEGLAVYFGKYFSINYFDATTTGNRQIPNFCTGTMRMDAQKETVAMTAPIKFYPIYYEKAACVISMFHAILGNRFQTALGNYITNRKFNSVTPDHLANEFNKVAHESPALIPAEVHFKTILDTWHTQAGLPIIDVNYNLKTGDLTITQRRYTTEPVGKADQFIWWIPFDVIFASDALKVNDKFRTQQWLSTRSQVLKPTEAHNWTGDKWILINKQMGYYRVNYNTDNWRALSVALKSGQINSLNRAQLIDDAFEFAEQKMISYDIAMSLLSYIPLIGETDCFVWTLVNNRLEYVYRKLRGYENIDVFLAFVQRLTASIFEKLGIYEQPNENITTFCTRQHIIKWACRSGLESCLTSTTKALSDHINGIHILLPHVLKTVTLEEGSSHLENPKVYFEMYIKFTNTSYGISWQHILKLLELLLDVGNDALESDYRDIDCRLMIMYVMENHRDGPNIIMEFLEKNIIRITKVMDDKISEIFGALSKLIMTNVNKAQFERLLKLFDKSDRFVKNVLKNINDSLDWLEINSAVINKWLISERYNSMKTTLHPIGKNLPMNEDDSIWSWQVITWLYGVVIGLFVYYGVIFCCSNLNILRIYNKLVGFLYVCICVTFFYWLISS